MQFDISKLPPEGARVLETLELPAFVWDGGEEVASEPTRVDARLKRTRRGIEMVGGYETVLRLSCSRCLGAVRLPLEREFRLFLLPALEEGEEPFEAIDEDDPDAIDLYPLEGKTVDLAAVLQEQIDLALPYRVLCSDDCKGLCQSCRANLNHGACGCPPVTDERWSTLEQLKARLTDRKDRGPSKRS